MDSLSLPFPLVIAELVLGDHEEMSRMIREFMEEDQAWRRTWEGEVEHERLK